MTNFMQTTPATAKGTSTRERILAAARAKLIEQGIDQFALREIADALAIKLSNVQYYFKTRELLIYQVIEAEAARDRTLIRSHQDSDKTPTEVLRAIVSDLTTRWRGEGGVLCSTLGTLAIHNKDFQQLYRAIYADFYTALEVPLQSLNPKLSAQELGMRARLITALIDGAPMQPQIKNKRAFQARVQAEAEAIALA